MKIKVQCLGEQTEILANPGPRLLDFLQSAGVPVQSACGGNGVCHKCRVRVNDGFIAIGSVDRLAFNPTQLEQGWRLSCQAFPKTNLEVLLPSPENTRAQARVVLHEKALNAAPPQSARLICDLGSTGIVVALVEKTYGLLAEAHLLNKQVRYGADVMTRLHAAQNKGVEPLRKNLESTLSSCLKSLQQAAPMHYSSATHSSMICAGNSAMTSFLHGWDISSLAVAPFQPWSRAETRSTLAGVEVQSLPLLAGFVGGDTVAGILCLEDRSASEPWMLVDIGTNTEIVLNSGKGELWFSSAPAGPAFEGGNISQGMRAESGAISEARFVNGRWELRTIGQDMARGICGSGLVDLIHEGVQAGLIAGDGFVQGGRLELTPEISLLADDVREFQLAKSATRTAIDLLIQRAGTTPSQIYLAGAFAQNLRIDSVIGVGLLPAGIPALSVGNASLAGAFLYACLTDSQRTDFLKKLEATRRPVELALQEDFQDAFVRNLNFR